MKSLIAAMLIVDGKKRPSIKQILQFPLVVQHVRKLLESNEFKEQFARGIMTTENYWRAYEEKLPLKQMDETTTKKCSEFDEQLSNLNHDKSFKPATG